MRDGVDLIAEVGQAHDGSLGLAHSYVDAVADAGVSTVKFQVHIAEAESSCHEPFRVAFSYEDQTRYDYWKRMEFTAEQWDGLKRHCEQRGLEFLASPFSVKAVELLENIGVRRYKIGSGEIQNLLMLGLIAKTGKPILLSTGLASFSQIDETVDFLTVRDSPPLALLQCTTSYPTTPEQLGLNVIPELRRRYGVRVGLSDHSGTIYPAIAAVAVGAEIVEFHVVFDRRSFGPDAKASVEVREVRSLVEGVQHISRAIASPIDKGDSQSKSELQRIFGKSLAVNRDLAPGHLVEIGDLETKKPAGLGLPASRYEEVVGRRTTRALAKWAFINEGDVE